MYGRMFMIELLRALSKSIEMQYCHYIKGMLSLVPLLSSWVETNYLLLYYLTTSSNNTY